MKSILSKKLNGQTPLAVTSGTPSFYHNSNLYHAIRRLGFTEYDYKKKFDVVIGGRAGKNLNDGYHMAIVSLL